MKPRGTTGNIPEMTRLKLAWRDDFDEPTREFWRGQFESAATQAELRALLKRETGIDLLRDTQLTEFRAWLKSQDDRDAEAERQQADEEQSRLEHPEWSDEERRMYVINCSLNRAIATGDFEGLGLKAVRAAQTEVSGKTKAQLENEKLALARQAEERAQQEFKLAREKFEFDAAKACLAKLPELQAVSTRPKLTEDEKAIAIQQILFPK